MIYHKHHIVPKHAGGCDEAFNLVRLTVPEHAEAHRVLWKKYGRLQDKLAWLMLSGRTEEGELIRRQLVSQRLTGRKLSVEHKRNIARARLGKPSPHKGRAFTSETTRQKIRVSKLGKPRPDLSEINRKRKGTKRDSSRANNFTRIV